MNQRTHTLRDEVEFDLSPATEAALIEYFKTLALKQELEAQIEQDNLSRQLREGRSLDGVGALEMRVHATAYHHWAHRFGTYECWADPQFRHDFLKRAPECKVTSTGTKMQVGWTPETPQRIEIHGSGNAPRFSKNYGK